MLHTLDATQHFKNIQHLYLYDVVVLIYFERIINHLKITMTYHQTFYI